MTACSGEDSSVKELVCRYKELLSLVKRALPHAANARSKFPRAYGRQLIFNIVVDGMQHKIEACRIGTLLKFLPAILLIGECCHQCAAA